MAQDSQEAAVVRPVADILEQRNAGNSSGYILPKLHSMKEQNPNLALLDIGCGPGTISSTLAKIIPDGHVTGIDKSPDIIPRARDLAEESGVKNIEFQQGDAYKLPFADGAFDITICHQMLTYLKAPWDALSEMIRVTKVGGIIAAREGDLTSECVWPELPGLVKFHKLAGDLIKGGGGTDKGGRQLLSWALKAGVKREMITVSHSTWSYSTPKEKQIWSVALIERVQGSQLRGLGLKLGLTTGDLDEIVRHWTEWAERDDASIAMMHGEIIIRR
ncbi:putative methyltransferase C1B3.06c [Lachnellula cervina]|uniref:Putative methyltransferase C1B3.06c n=1 Tax=Lachnellula cervina TaxID=1316786 RepID=A0A7D8UM43_9HELO|nr:putative methyltransferase C1B3.06c [Lachnellula cervina]